MRSVRSGVEHAECRNVGRDDKGDRGIQHLHAGPVVGVYVLVRVLHGDDVGYRETRGVPWRASEQVRAGRGRASPEFSP